MQKISQWIYFIVFLMLLNINYIELAALNQSQISSSLHLINKRDYGYRRCLSNSERACFQNCFRTRTARCCSRGYSKCADVICNGVTGTSESVRNVCRRDCSCT